jgi:hypothetical protein
LSFHAVCTCVLEFAEKKRSRARRTQPGATDISGLLWLSTPCSLAHQIITSLHRPRESLCSACLQGFIAQNPLLCWRGDTSGHVRCKYHLEYREQDLGALQVDRSTWIKKVPLRRKREGLGECIILDYWQATDSSRPEARGPCLRLIRWPPGSLLFPS